MPSIADIAAAYRRQVQANADAYASGARSLPEWYSTQQRVLRNLHVAVYQEGYRRPLEGPQRAAITVMLRRQEQFLTRWQERLAARDVRPTADALFQQSLLYLAAASATYGRATTDRLGMPPLPAYPGDATTKCHIGCRCYWSIIDRGDGDFDCTWVLRPAEHCPHCSKRAQTWAPLLIRNGVILRYDTAGLYLPMGGQP